MGRCVCVCVRGGGVQAYSKRVRAFMHAVCTRECMLCAYMHWLVRLSPIRCIRMFVCIRAQLLQEGLVPPIVGLCKVGKWGWRNC
jgi:hypothetical protein